MNTCNFIRYIRRYLRLGINRTDHKYEYSCLLNLYKYDCVDILVHYKCYLPFVGRRVVVSYNIFSCRDTSVHHAQ